LVQLSGLFNVHRHTVTAHLKRNGIERRVNKRQLTDEQVEAARAMYTAWHSLAEIGNHFKVDGSTIAQEFRRVGVPIRPQGANYNRRKLG